MVFSKNNGLFILPSLEKRLILHHKTNEIDEETITRTIHYRML